MWDFKGKLKSMGNGVLAVNIDDNIINFICSFICIFFKSINYIFIRYGISKRWKLISPDWSIQSSVVSYYIRTQHFYFNCIHWIPYRPWFTPYFIYTNMNCLHIPKYVHLICIQMGVSRLCTLCTVRQYNAKKVIDNTFVPPFLCHTMYDVITCLSA